MCPHEEVPLEQTQEDLLHHAHGATEPWIMGVAVTAAILAVLAAITALLAEHHANEAMIEQIQSSDQWAYYQAKGIKSGVLTTRINLLETLGKPANPVDLEKLNKYGEEQEGIKERAEHFEGGSKAHLRIHSVLAFGVTMFQVAIAIGAISVLTHRRLFWLVALGFGTGGAVALAWGLLVVK
jgi:hypothetical protein